MVNTFNRSKFQIKNHLIQFKNALSENRRLQSKRVIIMNCLRSRDILDSNISDLEVGKWKHNVTKIFQDIQFSEKI